MYSHLPHFSHTPERPGHTPAPHRHNTLHCSRLPSTLGLPPHSHRAQCHLRLDLKNTPIVVLGTRANVTTLCGFVRQRAVQIVCGRLLAPARGWSEARRRKSPPPNVGNSKPGRRMGRWSWAYPKRGAGLDREQECELAVLEGARGGLDISSERARGCMCGRTEPWWRGFARLW